MNVHKNARQTPRGREWMVSLAARDAFTAAIAVAQLTFVAASPIWRSLVSKSAWSSFWTI
jgi:hypothetical protein